MQVLKFYNLEGQNKWLNLLYETCFLLLFLILAWCGAVHTAFSRGLHADAAQITQ